MLEVAAHRVVDSPIGSIAISASNRGIVKVDILTSPPKSEFSLSDAADRHCAKAAEQLTEYFAGKRKAFDLPLDLEGTDFQQRVWSAIASVGFGEQISYRELAEVVGKPLAARAAGGAVGANPVPILIGCHRVLGSGGRITGYSGGEGLKTKRWLLAHEQIGYAND